MGVEYNSPLAVRLGGDTTGVKFCAIAIEQSSPDLASGYSIGVARFRDNYIEGTWGCWVGPDLCGSRFPDVFAELSRYVDGGVVVHHAPPSRLTIEQDSKIHGIAAPAWIWLDSLVLMRCTWPKLVARSSDLLALAQELGIDCKKEDAVERAVATGVITVELTKTLGADMGRLVELAAASASGWS